MFIAIFCVPVCDIINFESYQAIFLNNQKSQEKNLNILRTKSAFKIKWKAVLIIFKGLLEDKGLILIFSTWFGKWLLIIKQKIFFKRLEMKPSRLLVSQLFQLHDFCNWFLQQYGSKWTWCFPFVCVLIIKYTSIQDWYCNIFVINH